MPCTTPSSAVLGTLLFLYRSLLPSTTNTAPTTPAPTRCHPRAREILVFDVRVVYVLPNFLPLAFVRLFVCWETMHTCLWCSYREAEAYQLATSAIHTRRGSVDVCLSTHMSAIACCMGILFFVSFVRSFVRSLCWVLVVLFFLPCTSCRVVVPTAICSSRVMCRTLLFKP